MFVIWLVVVFILGTVLGSFLNVCIYRVPLEKSVFWPGSRCGSCFQPIRWFDNIPIISYFVLRGRCRTCRASFSARYLLIELFTGACFAALFHLELIENIHGFKFLKDRAWDIQQGLIPIQGWLIFAFHAILFCFLLVATCCDLDRREIPLAITLPGTIIGLVGAVCLPWPWPYSAAEAMPGMQGAGQWWLIDPKVGPKAGLYPWPVWGPLPDWLPPGDWMTGLMTGLAGILVGTFMLRTVRYLFSKGLGVEALGLGDADLMMMAGSFLGWQPVVAAFFVAVIPALVFGLVQLIVFRDNSLPFGPSLAMGVVITWLGWNWLGPQLQPLFFHAKLMAILFAGSCVFMLIASYVIRMFRMARA